jgi:phage gp36-like protein
LAQAQYATWDDIQRLAITPAAAQRYGEPASTSMLQAASSLCDSYLASQFTLPLTVWDMNLTMNVCNIAAYMLACQFGFNPGAPADKLIETRYQNALMWLEQIRDEKIFPQYTDTQNQGGDSTIEAGPYVVSDPPVGFTDRGVNDDICNYTTGWFW